MCLGIRGRILELVGDQPDMATVDVQGVPRRINLALLADDPPRPGTSTLIHLGFALAAMTSEEAEDALVVLAEMGEGVADDSIALFERPPDTGRAGAAGARW